MSSRYSIMQKILKSIISYFSIALRISLPILNFPSFVRPFVSSFVRPSVTFLTATSNVNNSVIFHRRKVPRVANERYCYIFFIFGVHWGKGVKGGPLGGTKKKRKTTKIAEKRKTSSVNNAAKKPPKKKCLKKVVAIAL